MRKSVSRNVAWPLAIGTLMLAMSGGIEVALTGGRPDPRPQLVADAKLGQLRPASQPAYLFHPKDPPPCHIVHYRISDRSGRVVETGTRIDCLDGVGVVWSATSTPQPADEAPEGAG
jgi:hypothetical protein